MVRSSSVLDKIKKNLNPKLKLFLKNALNTYVPALKSLATDGRMHNGGTSTLVTIKSLGCANSAFIKSN